VKNILIIFFLLASWLDAQEVVVKKDCEKVTTSFKMMSDGTKINHKNIILLEKVLIDNSSTKEEKENAHKALNDMNKKTSDRALNSQYPSMYEEMKEAYIVNCGSFTAENNETIAGMVNRSIDFNNIMAKTIGDELSLSKIK